MNTNIKEVFDDMKFDDPEYRKMFIESYNELWESHEKMKGLLKRSREVIVSFLADANTDQIHNKIDFTLLQSNKIKKIV